MEAASTKDFDRQGDSAGERLIAITRELLASLRPNRQPPVLGLESRLDRDIGLDSLGRVELLLRVEKSFHVQLGEKVLGEAETLGDVLSALRKAAPGARFGPSAPTAAPPPEVEPVPAGIGTLIEALDWHADRHPDRVHIQLEGDAPAAITYGALRDRALRVAAGLRARGVAAGDRVAIMLPTGEDFFSAFFGAMSAGAVPVPIYPPFRPSQIEDHLRRQAAILRNAGARLLILPEEGRAVARLLRGQVEGMGDGATVAALSATDARLDRPRLQTGDMAMLQYTSGSTGDPKGVMLTHANLLANIRAMGEALRANSSDVFVSWLPLYHDMGLIGAWLGSLYHGVLAVIMSPLQFLTGPERWLWAIHRYRGTLSAAPNFAYELCLGKIGKAEMEGLDLSSWRVAANGAEPVSAETIRQFSRRFAPCGFRAETLLPVYGLAESAVGLAFPSLGKPPLIDRIRRTPLLSGGRAVPADENANDAIDLVACGHALPRHQIRIVDGTGHEAGDRREGRVQFKGPSTTAGYFNNPEQTQKLFDGEWLETGDLGYFTEGELVLTGRSKDIIIRAGRNIHPQEVEQAVGALEGVRRGCVVAFGSPDPQTGAERLVVVAETREKSEEKREALRSRVAAAATAVLDLAPDDIVLAPPRSVPKTSSGKIRRSACRSLYEQGDLGRKDRPLWWQILRLGAASLRARIAGEAARILAYLYAGYWWTALGVIGALAWCAVLLLPGRSRRWTCTHLAARAFLRATGIAVVLRNAERLEEDQAILVANHASYLDALALAAVLAKPPCFVAKKELAGQVIAGPFLRRIGTLFVERSDADAAASGPKELAAAIERGERLVIFPEGTLSRRPGLLPFRLGAFQVASLTGSPVRPILLRGVRSVLRGDQWFPRRGSIEIEAAQPIRPTGSDWAAMISLRDAVRQAMLDRIGEPDLADSDRDTLAP